MVQLNSENTVKRTPSVARLATASVLAVGITGSLFYAMQTLIHVDNYEHPPKEVRVLTAYVEVPEREDQIDRTRVKPKPMETAQLPPPPTKMTVQKVPVDIAATTIAYTPPEVAPHRDVFTSVRPIVTIDNTDAKPISPPVPVYPIKAAERGIEGTCDVRFDVNVRGAPFNIRPECSHQVFLDEAKRAISKVQFRPQIVSGRPVERRNVIYPLAFKLEN